jgi:hypothetical protein
VGRGVCAVILIQAALFARLRSTRIYEGHEENVTTHLVDLYLNERGAFGEFFFRASWLLVCTTGLCSGRIVFSVTQAYTASWASQHHHDSLSNALQILRYD